MPSSVYSPLAARVREHQGPIYPLNVGDTWMEPFEGGRMEDLHTADLPGLHRYCETGGIPPLVDALVETLRGRTGASWERDQVLVTAGATSGLACTVSALVDPGEEVLILAPFWPLIRGIVQSQRGVPVEVPFYDRVHALEDAVAAVETRITDRSVALYVCTPSNPTGRVLPADWLEAFAALARRHDLWLLSDEVYADYVYGGSHVSLASFAPERTLTVHSFSKAYGMAGNRVGYLAGPAPVIAEAHKVSVHSAYHAPHAGQRAALRALESGGAWVANARELYRKAGEDAAAVLGLPAPEGSCFLFIDVGSLLDERGMLGFLEDCLEDGVVLSPGASSGSDYGNWVRLCYTAVPPEEAAVAVRHLARQLGRSA
ncbi:MAG: pyridoxal phosphate-dependent aminotransferase [Deltaproteobacteria bacterium]|nr:pyridoxal phosphate-dependent aminotransferase [Deltaproteobacteria bacterium]